MDWLEEAMSVIPSSQDLTKDAPSHWSPLQYLGLSHKAALFEIIEQKRIPR